MLAEEDLDGAPRGFNSVRVVPRDGIDECDGVVDGSVHETVCVEIAVRSPLVTDDRSAFFDPVTNNCHQCVGGSIRHGNKECPARLLFNTAKHPVTLNRVSPMVFSPTELPLVNFDSLVRTTNFFGAALHEYQHGFPAEHAPVSDGT